MLIQNQETIEALINWIISWIKRHGGKCTGPELTHCPAATFFLTTGEIGYILQSLVDRDLASWDHNDQGEAVFNLKDEVEEDK